jgi:hypothetical protein
VDIDRCLGLLRNTTFGLDLFPFSCGFVAWYLAVLGPWERSVAYVTGHGQDRFCSLLTSSPVVLHVTLDPQTVAAFVIKGPTIMVCSPFNETQSVTLVCACPFQGVYITPVFYTAFRDAVIVPIAHMHFHKLVCDEGL